MIFSVKKKNWVWGYYGPPYYGIGATIRIGREVLCLPYAGFLLDLLDFMKSGDWQYAHFNPWFNATIDIWNNPFDMLP